MNSIIKALVDYLRENNQIFVIIGRPGAGKGTQRLQIQKLLEDDGQAVCMTDSGALFRETLGNRDACSVFNNTRIQEIQDSGKLQSPALAVAMWLPEILKKYNGIGHIIMDGTPRTILEAQCLENFMTTLYGISPIYIHIDVTEEESFERQKNRPGTRPESSTDEKLRIREQQYNDSTAHAVEYLESQTLTRVLKVDGNGSIEEITEKILDSIYSYFRLVEYVSNQ